MSPYTIPSPRALFQDRRVRIGAAVAASAVGLLGAGVIAVLASSSAEATSPKEADHGRLSIVTQPAPIPRIPLASDRLATLDPEALSADPADPRRQTLLADQGDFDTPISTEAPDATPPENPQPVDHSGGTSSKEDKPDPAPG